MPISMFKLSAKELGVNQIDRNSRTSIVNMTFFQVCAAKLLQKFLDPATVERQVFSEKPDADELK